MITFRDRGIRGSSRTGWLDSRHTFSFADYRDPEHGDMDIISYVLEGTLEHKDFEFVQYGMPRP